MRITEEQERILGKYKCVRLNTIPNPYPLIQSFHSTRGESLVQYLTQRGISEDTSGKTAFYFILSPDGIPCLFFSLQCGALFDYPFDAQRHLSYISANISSTDPNIQGYVYNKHHILGLYGDDIRKETGRQIWRVEHSYPSVELVHFCANDDKKDEWKSYGFRFPMGAVLFWKYVVPILESIRNNVGCEYIHLFAADNTADETLINYYTVSLGFAKEDSLGTTKPRYDFSCVFLSQKISTLLSKRQKFFDDFNVDPGEDIV